MTVIFVVSMTALAGCFGNGPGSVADEPRVEYEPCEHPWPCGDGSEWPSDLVAPRHLREPAALPDSMRVEGAELVAGSTSSSATFAWRIPSADAFDVAIGTTSFNPTQKLVFPVPEGLFLSWDLDMDVPGPATPGGRSFDLTLLDETGEVLCFTDHDFAIAGVSTGDENIGCTAGPISPLAAAADYAVVFQHEWDRAGEEIVVLITLEIAEPFLAFERLPVEPMRVSMSDGVELDGVVWRPKLPDGVFAPIILYTSPYFAQCSAQSEFLSCGPDISNEAYLEGYGLVALLREGYAIAIFNVRGTGASGGCYDAWGDIEQRDHAELVEWLAAQPWSNGRVGMTGISYAGTTPWEAAIGESPSLKALVVGGIISDVYLSGFTPQGAATDGSLYFHATTAIANSMQPPRGGDAATLSRYAPSAIQRACPEVERELLVHPEGAVTDERDAAWFEPRRLIDHFDRVTAAALVLHGVEDDNFHRFQEDIIWKTLPNAPKAMVLGQWDHTIALEEYLANYDGPGSWYEMSKVWFDFWLKGLGEPPTMLGTVAYQDTAMEWREDTAWPPPVARDEVLYFASGALQPEPRSGATSFRAIRSPTAVGERTGNPDLCANPDAATDPSGRWLVYETPPMSEDVVIAGNPMAYLELASDQPGGVVMVDLYVLGPDVPCFDPTTAGGADLRFHEGNMVGRDFPVNVAHFVRVDLYSTAARVSAGHRIAVVLSGGGEDYNQGQVQYAPTLTVTGKSHLVVPLVEGTVGGNAPDTAYPARPFDPRA